MNKLKTLLSISTLSVSALIVSALAINAPAHAVSLSDLFGNSSSQKGKFLSVEEAFRVAPSVQGNQLKITFDITEGHYVYRDKLKLTLPEGVTASKFTFDEQPYFVDDPNFGKVAVFDNESVIATTTLSNTTGQPITDAQIILKWQGCAKAGLCYPPEKIKVTVSLNADAVKKKVK